MRKAIRNINQTGVLLSKSKTNETIRKYSMLHSSMCERLYDLGYISTPLYFDSVDFWTTLLATYPELTKEFLNERTGEMNYSLSVIQYISNRTENKDIKFALESVAQLLRAEEALKDLGTLCEYVKFQKKKDTIVCKVNLGVVKSVINSNKIPLDSPYVRECFYLEPFEQVVEVDYSIILYKHLLKMLGLSTNVALEDSSLFLGVGFTIKDDCENLEALINSDIKGTGLYYNKLFEAVENYYTEYYSTRTTKTVCLDFYSQLFTDSLQECIDYLAVQRDKYPDAKEFYVTSTKLYLRVQVDKKNEVNFPDSIFVGERLYNLKGEKYDTINRLLGYSGIFVYEYADDTYKYSFSGLPVDLYTMQVQRGRQMAIPISCYPFFMVKERYNDDVVDIYPRNFCSDEKFTTVPEMLAYLEVDSLDNLAQEVAELVETGTSTYKLLVGRMVQTLICIMCDYTLPEHISPNQLKINDFKSWLTKETYLDACVEASVLFSKLGF